MIPPALHLHKVIYRICTPPFLQKENLFITTVKRRGFCKPARRINRSLTLQVSLPIKVMNQNNQSSSPYQNRAWNQYEWVVVIGFIQACLKYCLGSLRHLARIGVLATGQSIFQASGSCSIYCSQASSDMRDWVPTPHLTAFIHWQCNFPTFS